MKIFLFAIGARDRASSRWRIWDQVDWLRAQGHEVRVDSLAPIGMKKADFNLVKRIASRYTGWLRDFFWADAIIVQESMQLWPALLFKNLGKRRKLFFDFADPIDRVGTGLKRRMRQMMFELFARHSDAIIVENRSYADLLAAHRDRVVHFYGPVDSTNIREQVDALRQPASSDRPLRIGWTGSHGTVSFIRPLLPIIDELAREREIEVMFVGVPSLDHGLKHARAMIVPFDENAEFRSVPTFDLALFRLEDTEDALWRGGGKLFIYMSSGAPFIASDRGIASGIMREAKVGFPVKNDTEWPEMLRRAVEDTAARQEMTERSLLFARENLSYEQYRSRVLAVHLDGTGN